MTTTDDLARAASPTAGGPAPTRRGRRRRRRWHPRGHAVPRPGGGLGGHRRQSTRSRSPTSATRGRCRRPAPAPHGSSRLAATAHGRAGSPSSGSPRPGRRSGRPQWTAATPRSSCPAPDFLHPSFAAVIADLPGSHRVVLVRPGLRTLLFSALPVDPAGSRWATATVAPGCRRPDRRTGRRRPPCTGRAYVTFDDAADASTATAARWWPCARGTPRSSYVGATEPFRNDRIDEVGNADLATGLLARARPGDLGGRAREGDRPAAARGRRPDFSLPQYRRGRPGPDQHRLPGHRRVPAHALGRAGPRRRRRRPARRRPGPPARAAGGRAAARARPGGRGGDRPRAGSTPMPAPGRRRWTRCAAAAIRR